MHSVVHHHLTTKPNQLREIYAAISIKMLGLSIFSVFIPIYLYTTGYSLRQVIGYCLIDYIMRLGIQPLAGLYIARFGPKHGLVVSAFANVALLLLFYTLPTHNWPLIIVAFMSAVASVFHFLAYFVDFSLSQKNKETGHEVGVMSQLLIVVTSIGPLVGGVIGSLYGPAWMLVVATIIVIASLIPLFASHEPIQPQSFDLSKLPWKQMAPDLVSSFGRSFDNRTANIVWPLALFLILQNYAKVGVVTTASFLAVFFTARIVSRRADRDGKQLVWMGSGMSSGIHIGRIIAATAVSVVSINILDGVANWMVAIPWMAQVYRNAQKTLPVEYLMVFNMVSDMGSVCFFVILFAATFFISGSAVLALGFILGAFGVMASPLLMRSTISRLQMGVPALGRV